MSGMPSYHRVRKDSQPISVADERSDFLRDLLHMSNDLSGKTLSFESLECLSIEPKSLHRTPYHSSSEALECTTAPESYLI